MLSFFQPPTVIFTYSLLANQILMQQSACYIPLDFLSVEYLDGDLVARQLVLGELHLAKAAVTQCLSQNVPGDTVTEDS